MFRHVIVGNLDRDMPGTPSASRWPAAGARSRCRSSVRSSRTPPATRTSSSSSARTSAAASLRPRCHPMTTGRSRLGCCMNWTLPSLRIASRAPARPSSGSSKRWRGSMVGCHWRVCTGRCRICSGLNLLVRRLVDRGLVYRPTRGAYDFALPLFGDYLRRRVEVTKVTRRVTPQVESVSLHGRRAAEDPVALGDRLAQPCLRDARRIVVTAIGTPPPLPLRPFVDEVLRALDEARATRATVPDSVTSPQRAPTPRAPRTETRGTQANASRGGEQPAQEPALREPARRRKRARASDQNRGIHPLRNAPAPLVLKR